MTNGWGDERGAEQRAGGVDTPVHPTARPKVAVLFPCVHPSTQRAPGEGRLWRDEVAGRPLYLPRSSLSESHRIRSHRPSGQLFNFVVVNARLDTMFKTLTTQRGVFQKVGVRETSSSIIAIREIRSPGFPSRWRRRRRSVSTVMVPMVTRRERASEQAERAKPARNSTHTFLSHGFFLVQATTTRTSHVVQAADRPLWFPGAAPPSYLDGSVAGDRGFDPIGLGAEPRAMAWYRAAELVHARWAMLGVAGILAQEVVHPEQWWYTSGLPENLPAIEVGGKMNIGGLLAWEFLLMHWVELRRWQDIQKPGSVNSVRRRRCL